ncbi:MAG: hypothetical protein ACRDTF_16260, partial [Pseudonocardiaceae bacterium]
MRPPDPVRPPRGTRSDDPGRSRRIPRPLGVLLVTLIAGAALLGLAAPTPATTQPTPPQPTPSQPTAPPAETPDETAESPEGLRVSGTLRDNDTPLERVRVLAIDSSGEQVDDDLSDASGRWELAVPTAGRYT